MEKNKTDILFESNEQKEATERVLAAARIKSINNELDKLSGEAIQYANNIDKLLERNKLESRYLERIGILENVKEIYLDNDLKEVDFRLKEIIEDLIKRINTRINLINHSNELIKELNETYKINYDTLKDDVDVAKLNRSDFENIV